MRLRKCLFACQVAHTIAPVTESYFYYSKWRKNAHGKINLRKMLIKLSKMRSIFEKLRKRLQTFHSTP